MPWNLHEPEPGSFDFEGRCDLPAFLELCQEHWGLGFGAGNQPGAEISRVACVGPLVLGVQGCFIYLIISPRLKRTRRTLSHESTIASRRRSKGAAAGCATSTRAIHLRGVGLRRPPMVGPKSRKLRAFSAFGNARSRALESAHVMI